MSAITNSESRNIHYLKVSVSQNILANNKNMDANVRKVQIKHFFVKSGTFAVSFLQLLLCKTGHCWFKFIVSAGIQCYFVPYFFFLE